MTVQRTLAPCPIWCTNTKGHQRDLLAADRNCWGPDHSVVLHLEDGAPSPDLSRDDQLRRDPPRINPFAHQRWYGLPTVYLHLYRPHENKYLDLDHNFHLTPLEAIELANALLDVVEEIGGAR